jgi:hypothetical protein
MGCRRVATIELVLISCVATRREEFARLSPPLKGGAEVTSTLRIESTCSDLSLMCLFLHKRQTEVCPTCD